MLVFFVASGISQSMKKLFISFAVAFSLLAFSSVANAQTPKPVVVPGEECNSPKDFIESLNDTVKGIVDDKKISDADKTEKLSEMFRKYVNINWIGRFVLGQNWRSLKPAQQTEYLKAYEDYLLRSYVPIFKEYKGQTVEFLSATQLKRPGEYIVATKIISSDEPDILVSYRIKKDASCFQVYDMVVEGVSLLNTQRQDFGSIFARKGYAELIAILKSKVAEPTPEAK
jgi:phospholipid transport system substrate-binding protein